MMDTNTNIIEADIASLGEYFEQRSCTDCFLPSIRGRIVKVRDPSELFTRFDSKVERIATLHEVLLARLESFDELWKIAGAPGSSLAVLESRHQLAARILKAADDRPELLSIWQIRLTTLTHMIHMMDVNGRDTLTFFDGNPFADMTPLAAAMRGPLSDGGVCYGEEALATIRASGRSRSLSYEDYRRAQGGNFTGPEFLNHPVFFLACGDRDLWARYVRALQLLSVIDLYHPGLHSGWLPGNMAFNFGRLVSLGYKGESFYPPNNSTVGHAALILPHAF